MNYLTYLYRYIYGYAMQVMYMYSQGLDSMFYCLEIIDQNLLFTRYIHTHTYIHAGLGGTGGIYMDVCPNNYM